MVELVCKEAKILSELIGYEIKAVSYHRPSKETLSAELEFPGLVNSYGHTFFKDFKYLSDSRRRWREPVLDVIASKEFPRLQILTHAFWYNDNEKDIHGSVSDFIKGGNENRWSIMLENITDLEGIMTRGEVC